ncbi:MAG TPA: hypothetical protein VNV37_02060, partial [Solirubrobacteraceae bacterium]|nr:hypothetical protein [Solirubrobacteraceae bacterium]
ARLDLDEGRIALATVELERAYAAALVELAAPERPGLDARIAELRQLRPGVSAAVRAALGEDGAPAPAGGTPDPAGAPDTKGALVPPGTPHTAELDTEALGHALARLEAALRARTAGL